MVAISEEPLSYNLRGREARPNRLEVRLTDVELETLNQVCQRLDRTASAVVRLALATYIERAGVDDTQAFSSPINAERITGDT